MKFTLSWLKEYLDTDQNLDVISNKLTDIGLEVEEIINEAAALETFTVAKIIKANPHQDSNNLQICEVDVGQKDNLQIICGAKNARCGLKVIYAPIGSIIPTNKMKIRKSKIRGVESYGMLCSAAELGLGEDEEGIMEIDDKFDIGTKVTQIYECRDVVIDVNITPNRGDCLGVYGIARDLSSAGLGQLKELKIPDISGSFDSKIKVNINKEAQKYCSYFSGYYIKNITNKESPKWLKSRLEAIGVNSISSVVDITNYVMYCLNQPTHSYDANKIKDNITVRIAKKSEKFTSLKEIEYNLEGSELLICDDAKIAGLAGIIGGNSTTTLEDTKDIFLEAAFFESTNIARSGRKLKILSDARYRFERTTDLNGVKRGLNMAANLILQICGGEISNIVESGSNKLPKNQIDLDLDKIKKLLNVEIALEEVIAILENLGFNSQDLGKNKLQVTAPSFRSDIKIEEDLIEEIIRIYGYNNIKSQALKDIKYQPINHKFNFNDLRLKLCNSGLDEIISWSFIDSNIASHFTTIQEKLIVSNAISEEMNYMRPSLIPGLILAFKKNQLRGFSNLSLFEVGKIFLNSDIDGQIESVAALRVGKNKSRNHYKDDRNFDVMDIKKDLFTTLETLGINPKSVQITSDNSNLPSYYHPYKSALITMGKNIIGAFGEAHPIINKKFDVKGKINIFELFTNKLPIKKSKSTKKVFIKSDFQIVNRDFAFILDKETQISDLIKLVKNTNQELINEVSIFDIYEGDSIKSTQKSVAFNVEIIPKLQTLNTLEIEEISTSIINIVTDKLNGVLRNG